MRILYAIREDYLNKKGGDTFQMIMTKKYIEKKHNDIIIKIINNPNEIKNYVHYDILHVFNMQDVKKSDEYIKLGKEYGMRIVLSPIYWDLTDSIFVNRIIKLTTNFSIINISRIIKKIINFNIPSRKYMGKKYKKNYIELLSKVDILLPNSTEESYIINKFFNVHSYNTNVVPNAISISQEPFKNNNNYDNYNDCLLEVARIEPTKNQLALIKACIKTNFPIVFVGSVNDLYSNYYKKVLRLANKRGNVYFLGEKSQEELRIIYKKAKVHVLPSFRESPGLVTLEALYYGCNVVVSDKKYCPIKYYQFDEIATICNPYSIKSINKAVITAMQKEKSKLPKAYFERFSYNNVAEKTYFAYKKLLKEKNEIY